MQRIGELAGSIAATESQRVIGAVPARARESDDANVVAIERVSIAAGKARM